jgi:hypothetical protein
MTNAGVSKAASSSAHAIFLEVEGIFARQRTALITAHGGRQDQYGIRPCTGRGGGGRALVLSLGGSFNPTGVASSHAHALLTRCGVIGRVGARLGRRAFRCLPLQPCVPFSTCSGLETSSRWPPPLPKNRRAPASFTGCAKVVSRLGAHRVAVSIT